MRKNLPKLFPPKHIEGSVPAKKIPKLSKVLSEAQLHYMDILYIGGTGAGKSSTINALAGYDCAESHPSVDPVTDCCFVYSLSNGFRFWDIPGLGDDPDRDENTKKGITDILRCTAHEYPNLGIIDLVFLVVDINSRDLGSVFNILSDSMMKDFLIREKRMVIGLNQMDLLYEDSNSPLQKCDSFRRRMDIPDEIPVIPYSAKTGENKEKLIHAIVKTFSGRRIIQDSGIHF